MAADRAQHVAEVVRPALGGGPPRRHRPLPASSLAYQGYGRGLSLDEVRALSRWATDDTWPDLVVLLDVPVEVAAARLGEELDRIEQAGDGFHRRVTEGFRELAAAEPERWVVIDGAPPVDEVAAAVRVAVGSG